MPGMAAAGSDQPLLDGSSSAADVAFLLPLMSARAWLLYRSSASARQADALHAHIQMYSHSHMSTQDDIKTMDRAHMPGIADNAAAHDNPLRLTHQHMRRRTNFKLKNGMRLGH
jgi:hypothetical protein